MRQYTSIVAHLSLPFHHHVLLSCHHSQFFTAHLARVCLTVIVVTSLCLAQETIHLKNIARGGGAKVLADVRIPRDCLR